MKKKITVLFAITILMVSKIHGQIFSKSEIFKGVQVIKGKYYNGSGGKGYWDIKNIDSSGRTILKKSYKNKDLLSETKTVYDSNNNELMSIGLYNINRPNQTDTNWVISYTYSGNEIIKQSTKYSDEDSTIVQLIQNNNDSLYFYKETSYHYRKKENKSWNHTTVHQITKDKNGLMVQWIKEDDERKFITDFEYYQNGEIKRRVITRIPAYENEEIYLGGPGSDDQSWEYTYDKKGRVKVHYTIVGGKKYKIAKYKYK